MKTLKLVTTLFALGLVAVSLNAEAADRRIEPDFTLVERARGGKTIVSTKHYRPVDGTPVEVTLEGWKCSAVAPDGGGHPPQWLCTPNEGAAIAAVSCWAGSMSSMTLMSGEPLKAYEVTIDWRGGKP